MQQILSKGTEPAARDLPGRAQDVHVEVSGMSNPPWGMRDQRRRNTVPVLRGDNYDGRLSGNYDGR